MNTVKVVHTGRKPCRAVHEQQRRLELHASAVPYHTDRATEPFLHASVYVPVPETCMHERVVLLLVLVPYRGVQPCVVVVVVHELSERR